MYINNYSYRYPAISSSKILWIIIIFFVICILYIIKQRNQIAKEIHDLANNAIEMTPEEFLKMRNTSFGGKGRKSYALTLNYPGVYILHNKTKDLYYVGQGTKVLNRVYAHFTGRGNGDVYADYKYGDKFTIRTIALKNSGFSNLNDLERYCISYYNAYYKGYNKTRGNKR